MKSHSASGGGRWGLARVHGASMEPLLRDGDRLVVRHGAAVAVGDLVLARFPDATVVKRIHEAQRTRTGAPGWWLLSEDPEVGVDSRHRGVVDEQDVLALVLVRLWPRPRRLRRRRGPTF